MKDGYLRGQLSSRATPRQLEVLAAFVTAGGSVSEAAALVGIRPSTAKRHLADLRARSGLTTEQLIMLDGLAAGSSSRVWSPTDSPAGHLRCGSGHEREVIGREANHVDRRRNLGR